MASKLDLALDDVIKQNKRDNRKQFQQKRPQQQNRQRSTSSISQRFTNRSQQQNRFGSNGGIQKRSGNINSRLGSFSRHNNNNNNNGQRNSRPARRNTNQPWAHDLFKEGSSIHSRLGNRNNLQQRRNQPQAIILVENVHYDVTEEDLKDVFNLVGTVEKCRIQYDKSGRSTGSAKVTFSHSDAVQKAINKFNNVDFDGQPMKISTPEKSNFNDRKSLSSGSPSASASASASVSRQTRSRTADDLDAELEAYNNNNSNDNNNDAVNDEDTMMLD